MSEFGEFEYGLLAVWLAPAIYVLIRWLWAMTVHLARGVSSRAPAARVGNGASHARVGPPPADRLTKDEAEQLADFLEDASDREIRDELKMTPELARQAAAGADLAPEIITQVQEFLAS